MATSGLTRRDFARTLGTGLGAALLHSAPLAVPAAVADVPRGRPEGAVRLDANENPYGPSPKALEAMTHSQGVASRYPDRAVLTLVDAIAKHHGVASQNVVLGCGSGEILRVADMAFSGPGTRVVAAEPTFEVVLTYAKVTRAEATKVPLTADFRHDLPRMAEACKENAHLVYVCNPNNPTGTIVGRTELEAFLQAVPPSTVVVLDEAYHHFVEDPSYASGEKWLARFPNLIVVRTFSKVFGLAGMRLGYAVSGNVKNIEAMQADLTFSNANAAVLEAALVSFEDTDHLDRQRKLNSETRAFLASELDKDHRRYVPSQTNFVMIYAGRDAQPIIEAFKKKGILIGRRFPSMGDWLRVSLGTREEVASFVSALREIVPAKA